MSRHRRTQEPFWIPVRVFLLRMAVGAVAVAAGMMQSPSTPAEPASSLGAALSWSEESND